jgi:choice-of-anchor B domain-containing protein
MHCPQRYGWRQFRRAVHCTWIVTIKKPLKYNKPAKGVNHMNKSRLLRLCLGVALLLLLELTGYGLSAAAPLGNNPVVCTGGMAGAYPCDNVDLLSHLPLSAIGAEDDTVMGNDHWGWTDPQTNRHYVIFGLTNGTSFIDITDPENPLYLGKLPTHDGESVYRDVKVYQNIAYIVADNLPNHGMQMFDLTELRNVANPPVTFSETAHYAGMGAVHTLWINEDSATLYGILRADGPDCDTGVQIMSLQNPLVPAQVGCLDEGEAPISTAECLVYDGPDHDYHGREICFFASDDNVSIADVTNPAAPTIIKRFTYPGIMRAHQGSMTEDLHYWLLADMHDEMHHGHDIRTHVFDIQDLDNPVVLGYYQLEKPAMDHSLFIVGNHAYEANARAGLQILDISSLPNLNTVLAGYFDVDPDSDSPTMNGAWSVYPFWDDNIVTISDTDRGLFVTQFVSTPTDVSLTGFGGQQGINGGWYLLPVVVLLSAVLFLFLRLRRPATANRP